MSEKYTSLNPFAVKNLHLFSGLVAFQAVPVDLAKRGQELKLPSFDEAKVDADVAQLNKAGFNVVKKTIPVRFGEVFTQPIPDISLAVRDMIEKFKSGKISFLSIEVEAMATALEVGDNEQLLKDVKVFIRSFQENIAKFTGGKSVWDAVMAVRDSIEPESKYIMHSEMYVSKLEDMVRKLSQVLTMPDHYKMDNFDLTSEANALLQDGDSDEVGVASLEVAAQILVNKFENWQSVSPNHYNDIKAALKDGSQVDLLVHATTFLTNYDAAPWQLHARHLSPLREAIARLKVDTLNSK